MSDSHRPPSVSRRDLLRIGGSLGMFLAAASLPTFTARAEAIRPSSASPVPDADALKLWYSRPGAEAAILEQGLPIGNGRIGALVTGDPARDALYVADNTLWTGGLNATLDRDGQFPYGSDNFGTFGLLAKAFLSIPAHAAEVIENYQRRLDLSNGLTVTTYRFEGVTYRREVFASHPDDVVVVRLTHSGGGSYTGGLKLEGTRGEPVTADRAAATVSFGATLANGLRYGAVVCATGTSGTVSAAGATVSFAGCSEVLIVVCAGTNYSTNAATGFKDASVDPVATARARAGTAAAVGGATLLATHVADYQPLFRSLAVDLGPSTAAQRSQDTAARLTARGAAGSAPDPELEACYLQFGRYLMIAGSRGGLPLNLQGLWIDRNDPSWMSDYHTDINVQMNYWLSDRAGLSSCFDAFADYCVNQVASWQEQTHALFNDPRNGFRNSSGRIAGWTTAISTNIYGGMGWWWHPAGNAWLCVQLFEHYEFTLDAAYLARIHPLLKGACEFWEARLLTSTITDPATGASRQVLIDDSDWSPEHGPTDAKGITYAQELVWQLFRDYRAACAVLGRDLAHAAVVGELQNRLHLPRVGATTERLQEWMTDEGLGETAHRHLSPLIGLFPGDRISFEDGPAALVVGARNLLADRGTGGFGWACAWRALCWARLKNADRAYELVTTVMKPSVNHGNGSAINMFDMYSFGGSSTFQIDANFGTATAILDMLVYSRPGLVELLPAVPAAWQASGSVEGVGVRGGFTVDFAWTAGAVTTLSLHSTAGTETTVRVGSWERDVRLAPGGSVTLAPEVPPAVFTLVNRRSGKLIDVPGSSDDPIGLIQYSSRGSNNQHWRFSPAPGGAYQITNVHSGLAMDVFEGTQRDGAPIIQYAPTGATNQLWNLVDAGDGHVKLVSVRSGKVIGVTGDSGDDGAALVQQADSGSISRHWRRVPL